MISDSAFRTRSGLPLFALIATLFAPAAMAQVFINEIHYDNASTDEGEAIEVAGAAGTDLSGWSLVLYNGSNGTVYNTIALTDTLADQQGGYGTSVVNLPVNGLQNGAPDGIALVDASSNVVQFLSYEGTFVAVGGPANGMTSTDIGVAEGSSTAVGDSLQLTGTGTSYADFAWTGPSPNTFGAVNTGQTFSGEPALPALVINEIDYDQPGTDAAEFIEIRNNSSAPASLAGWTLELVNGNGGAVYASIDLTGPVLAAGDYFVVCANAATVANCDLDVSPDTNLVQNGAPDAVALAFEGAVVDAVSYEGDVPLYVEGSGSGLADPGVDGSLSRCPDGADTNQNNVDFTFVTSISPGAENICPSGALEVKIHEVQGAGAESPLVGALVRIEGIVVGDFQDSVGTNGDLNGFHVQEEDSDVDNDAQTSEGIFVFNGSSPAVDVNIGDLVAVEGVVSEFNGLTEITSFNDVTVLSSGNPLPTPASLTLPVASFDELEPFEGMSVSFAQSLVIAEYFNFDRYGEIVLSSERRLQPTAEFEPGTPEQAAAAAASVLDRITLDDGRTTQNPDPAIHPNGAIFDLGNLFRGGDRLQNVTGVLDYSFGLYRVQPTGPAVYYNDNPRTAAPDDVSGSIKAASLNVLNYFTTTDEGSNLCGPLLDQECRGADNAEELERQRAKLLAALTGLDADVVGLIEIENDPADAAVADLVAGLNDALGAGTYDYVATGPIGSDAIRVALIYKPAAVTPWGGHAILDGSVDARFNDDLNRPVLAQSFQDNSRGGIITVAIAHLKSKGSDCVAAGDPDTGDGQGNCNLTRVNAAAAMVDWLAGDPTGSGVDNALVLGDLNSYDKEDPIDVFVAAGYTDLILDYQGEDAYGYLFDAQLGYLDHALANGALEPDVTGTTIWHINADEPDLLDYDTSFKRDNQDAIYAPDAYRASDHDPVVVGLDVCETTAPSFDALSATPSILWPANNKYVDVAATLTVSDNFDPAPVVTLVSVTSNEPDNGKGDGNTTDDIVILDDTTFKLRASRAGGGDGRIYTITYSATDACGNTATDTVEVLVPHDRRK
jgi:hypothetical protein